MQRDIAFALVKKNGYPDQMEKEDKQMYVSTKPLAILFRDLKARACELILSTSTNMGEEIVPDVKYLTPDRFQYMGEAVKIFREYRDDASLVILQFGLHSGDAHHVISCHVVLCYIMLCYVMSYHILRHMHLCVRMLY